MLVDELKSIVGPNGWCTDAEALQPHLTEWRGVAQGRTVIMLSPSCTDEAARIVSACSAAGVGIVPQGGNTGLCGGAIPDQSGEQVLMSLSRLNQIRGVEPDNFSMTVEAGCTLADAQAAAREEGRMVPLSLAAEGSCQIGGNLSTNAGGINVIRYGNARQQVLGLEVVLADGSVWDGLRSLRKDNAGYDLKQLFIGSEGTLGIITAATLRLFPDHQEKATALVAIQTPGAAVRLLGTLRTACSDKLVAFELMSDRAYRIGRENIGAASKPFDASHSWYVLLEAAGPGSEDELQEALAGELESGQVDDAVVAKNSDEAEELWRIRHAVSAGQKSRGVSIKHDIAVPIAAIEEFMAKAEPAVIQQVPDARIVAFGHVGDGNLHYNISQPVDADPEEFRERATGITDALFDLVQQLGGTFSAEHGVGVFKKPLLEKFRGGIELDMMRTLKRAMDPQNILNPGKVI